MTDTVTVNVTVTRRAKGYYDIKIHKKQVSSSGDLTLIYFHFSPVSDFPDNDEKDKIMSTVLETQKLDMRSTNIVRYAPQK